MILRGLFHINDCGRDYPLIDRIMGRTDDMIKVKGVNIYPGQIENVLCSVNGFKRISNNN